MTQEREETRDILQGAKAVKLSLDGRHAIIWHGGVQFTVAYVNEEGALRWADAFENSDGVGNPLDRERALEAMQQRLDLIEDRKGKGDE